MPSLGSPMPPDPGRLGSSCSRPKNLGVSRVMTIIRDAVDSDEVPDSFAADCETAGVELSG